MKTLAFPLTALAALLFAANVLAADPIWTASGFKTPESVEYDAARDRFYVSNINGGVSEQDGNGSIGLIDGKGGLVAAEWVKGLHSPKGLALHKGKLYVADVKELVVVNVDTGKVIARYEADDSKVLNGISISASGQVFVSDWLGNRIYKLEDGELKVWLSSDDLDSPNGLWVEGNDLYVASWGKHPKEDFTTETSGVLKKISLKTKAIKTIGSAGKPWMNMDGIARYDKKHWLISDFIKGEIYLTDNQGQVKKTITSKKGSADLYYIAAKHWLVVPLFLDNQVVAYQLD